jgi:hypothetical protein
VGLARPGQHLERVPPQRMEWVVNRHRRRQGSLGGSSSTYIYAVARRCDASGDVPLESCSGTWGGRLAKAGSLGAASAVGRQFQFGPVTSSRVVGVTCWPAADDDELPLRRAGRRDLAATYDGCTREAVVDDSAFLTSEQPEVAGCRRSRTAASQMRNAKSRG